MESIAKTIKELEKLDKQLEKLKSDSQEEKKKISKKSTLSPPKYKGKVKSLIDFKGFTVSPISWSFAYGFIPLPPFLNKNFKTLIIYFDRNRNVKFIGIKKSLDTVLTYLKKEDYIINNSFDSEKYELYHYNNKSILWLHPDFPMNMQIDLNKQKLLCDTKTFHNLINNVVQYRLTQVSSGLGGIGDLLKDYWWIILIGAGLYIASQQPEGLKGFFGL